MAKFKWTVEKDGIRIRSDAPWFEIVVHRYFGCGDHLFLSTKGDVPRFDMFPLETVDLQRAKECALDLVRDQVRLYNDICKRLP